jgi:hypothetical protein
MCGSKLQCSVMIIQQEKEKENRKEGKVNERHSIKAKG